MNFTRTDMCIDKIKKFCYDMKDTLKAATITGGGEPLMYDNFKELVDVMFDMNHVIFFSRGNLKKIEDISSLGVTQKQQILYLFSRIISIYIEYYKVLPNVLNISVKLFLIRIIF